MAYGDARDKGNEEALKRQDSLDLWSGGDGGAQGRAVSEPGWRRSPPGSSIPPGGRWA